MFRPARLPSTNVVTLEDVRTPGSYPGGGILDTKSSIYRGYEFMGSWDLIFLARFKRIPFSIGFYGII
jgi:hypothetical protein